MASVEFENLFCARASYSFCSKMEFKIIPGFRKDSKLLHLVEKDELFIKNRDTPKRTYYVCYEKGCKVRVCLEGDRCFYMKEQAIHTHGDVKKLIAELYFRNGIKEKCTQSSVLLNTPTTVGNVRSIFNSELLRYFWIYHKLVKIENRANHTSSFLLKFKAIRISVFLSTKWRGHCDVLKTVYFHEPRQQWPKL